MCESCDTGCTKSFVKAYIENDFFFFFFFFCVCFLNLPGKFYVILHKAHDVGIHYNHLVEVDNYPCSTMYK